ncbi:hypothetical protein [Facklamia hominis]
MMNNYQVIMVVSGAVFLMGALLLNYNLYQLVAIDARARGMKHPRLWGALSLSDGHGTGLVTYLLFRRKYARRALTQQESLEFSLYKKKAQLSLIIFLVGAVPLIVTGIYYLGLN